jgi:hypothetical protein
MASELAQDTVVPQVNGIDESLAVVDSTSSEAVNTEATKALVNG